MTELYVEYVMSVVSKYCQDRRVSEGLFWHWLGNTKFKEDDGNLTPERARLIRLNVDALFKEFQGE